MNSYSELIESPPTLVAIKAFSVTALYKPQSCLPSDASIISSETLLAWEI